MKQLVMIQATFLMDPAETYQHLYQFQYELKQFFNEQGMDVEPIDSVKGQIGSLVMFVSKKQEDPNVAKKPDQTAVKPLIPSVKSIQKAIQSNGGSTNRTTL